MKDDRVADVRNSDAVAHGGGGDRLAGQEHLQEKIPVHFPRQLHEIDHGSEDGFLVAAFDAVMNAARAQSLRQAFALAGLLAVFAEQIHGNAQPAGRRPLEELSLVETVLVSDLVSGQAALFEPPVNSFFAYI